MIFLGWSFKPPAAPSTDGVPAALQKYPDVAFLDDSGVGGSPLAPLEAIHAAAQLASALSGSVPPALAQTEQLQRKLLKELQRVPGMTAASLKSIRSELVKAVRGGAPAVTGFVYWLKGELMGPRSGQRDAPPSSARPVPAKPVSPRAASPAAAPAVDSAAAKTQQRFASTLSEAGSLNQRLVAQMQASQYAWNSAQKQMAQFYWQAAGGQAATPRLQAALAQLQGSIQELRKAHAQSNDPLAQLKSEKTKLLAIQREAGGMGLAPQTRQTLGQVDKWAQSGQQWRTNLKERIQTLEKWAQAAQTSIQARADAGAQGAAISLAVPPPEGAAASVVGAARTAERAQQQQTARLPELGGESATAVPSGPGAPGAPVEQPRGGASTGEAAGEVAQRWLAQVAEELQRVQQQIAKIRRTQLAGGNPEIQAQRERDFYDQSRLAQMGVTYNQLQDYLQTPQGPAGTDGQAVRAGMGSQSSTGRHALPMTDMFGLEWPNELNAQFLRDGVLIESDESHARRPPLTAEEEQEIVGFLEERRQEDEIDSSVTFFFDHGSLHPEFLDKLRTEADRVVEATRQITGLALDLHSIRLTMTPADVHLDIHRDGVFFRYIRRLSAEGTPTIYFPLGDRQGPSSITQHESKGAVIAGTLWRGSNKNANQRWSTADYRDRVNSLREQGHAVNYRAIPHGVSPTLGVRVGTGSVYVETSPAGPLATGPQPGRGRRLLMSVDMVPSP